MQTTTVAQSTATTNTNTTTTAVSTSSVTKTQSSATTPVPGSIEASLLAGQPPGTVIKCVTAQVISTAEGPRIVLQGLQGSDFTPQQLNMVQQQVKQQLLKGWFLRILKNLFISSCMNLNALLINSFVFRERHIKIVQSC